MVFGDVKSGRTTYGHRFLAPGPIELARPADYEAALEKAHVVADISKRRALLVDKLRAAAKGTGGQILEDESLVDQVTNLVELPNPVVGTFDERHLDLPPEVLVQEMKSHQRYFSLTDAKGKLLPKFIAVSNTPVRDEKLSLRGYERVLRSRLADGRFFFDEDRKTPLIERVPKLARVVWQGQLGSYAEKVDRFRALAVFLASQTGKKDQRAHHRAGGHPGQGGPRHRHGGRVPRAAGRDGPRVRPRRRRARGRGRWPSSSTTCRATPNDSLPTQDAGALIGLADRLDTLCGIFAIGKAPTGAADPFGLRRACLAIIHIVLGRGYRFSLSAAVDEALKLLEPKLRGHQAQGRRALAARAGAGVLPRPPQGALVGELPDGRGGGGAVRGLRRPGGGAQAAGGAQRAGGPRGLHPAGGGLQARGQHRGEAGQGRGQGPDQPREASATSPSATSTLPSPRPAAGWPSYLKSDDFSGALKEITGLKPAVDTFFDKVTVMADDKDLRENRVRFLVEIGALFNQVADFSKIQAEATA